MTNNELAFPEKAPPCFDHDYCAMSFKAPGLGVVVGRKKGARGIGGPPGVPGFWGKDRELGTIISS